VLAVVFGRFLGVLILVPGRYLRRFVPGFSFLVFGSWALLVRALLVVVLGGFRLTRQSAAAPPPTVAPPAGCGWRVVAGELWLAGYFKGCFCRRVCAGGLCGR
jgi:hypothetical protein